MKNILSPTKTILSKMTTGLLYMVLVPSFRLDLALAKIEDSRSSQLLTRAVLGTDHLLTLLIV